LKNSGFFKEVHHEFYSNHFSELLHSRLNCDNVDRASLIHQHKITIDIFSFVEVNQKLNFL